VAGPLSGIKVLDLSRILAGPWATQMLADYGATVWKIEQPDKGDDTRRWGPPFAQNAAGQDSSESAYFLCANRGKKSFAIDITSEAGQQQIRQLACKADILVENFKVGSLRKYGLDYASLSALNPQLIYCSITGFGQDGPYAAQAGYDAMIQAMGGLMSITGEPQGMPGSGPQKVGVAVTDLMSGLYAVTAILAALQHRHQTGEGQHIDLALLDTQVACLANQGSSYLLSGELPKPLGTAHPSIVPYQALKVADGHILLAVGNDKQFKTCCALLGCPQLAEHRDYCSNAQRVKHRDKLIPQLQAQLVLKPLAHWLDVFATAHVPCGPINTLDKVFADPQVRHRGLQFSLTHPEAGEVPQVANPVKFSRTPIEYKQAPPLLGQHNSELDDLLGEP
jgi:crotonobetainyl-CoA:carnitine CoA-transferase CaiB-like acyl-CoA transferase